MLVVILWSLVQIILESLPVSSSGHVALLLKILQQFGYDISFIDVSVLDFLLHGPTVIILLCFFFYDWWKLILQQPVSWKVFFTQDGWQRISRALLFVGIADFITFVFWWLDILPTISLTLGFSITALLLYSSRYYKQAGKLFDWSLWYAISLGFIQGVSLLPGISRFAATYMVGKYLGYTNKNSLEISFMIQFPLILGGFGKGLVGFYKNKMIFMNIFDFKILFVILCASIGSFVMLWAVKKIIQSQKLWCFSWYMIVPIVMTLLV